MLNRVILIGRLTRQPELRITPSGVSVTTMTLAVDRRPGSSGQKGTDFIDIVLFGKLAEVSCKYLDKGRLVAVEGRLQTRTYETRDGQRRKAWEVVGDNIQFLSPRNAGSDNENSIDNNVEVEEDREVFKE